MDGAVKPVLLPTASFCDISAKRDEDGQAEAVTSPNMSTDSGFEGEINKTFMQNPLPSPTDSNKMNAWESEALTEGDLENTDELVLAHSPRKSIEDSDFNESPFEKKSVPSAGDTDGESNDIGPTLDEENFHIVPLWSEEEGACAMMRNGYVVKDVSPTDMLLMTKNDEGAGGNVCVTVPTREADVNCWYYECTSGDCVWPDSSDYPNNQNGSPSEELRDIAVLESNDDNCSFSCSYSSDSADTLDAKKLGIENTSELSVTLMDMGEAEKNLVPVRPPRKMRCAKIFREETQSDEDVAVITMSPQFPVYKSSRSQSEPSHYTTVLKPKAIRPPAVNLDRTLYRSSIESLHGGHVATSFSNYHSRESAFRERPRSSLGQMMEVQLPFRLVETPSPVLISRDSSVHQSLATSAFTPLESSSMPSTSTQLPSAQKAHSLNNVSCSSTHSSSENMPKNGHKQGSKSTPLSGKRKIATSMSNSSQCSSDGDDREEGAVGGARSSAAQIKRHSMPWDLLWSNAAVRRPPSDQAANEEPIHMTLEEVRSSLQTCNSPANQSDDDNATKSEHLQCAKPCKRSLGTYLRRRKGPREGKAGQNGRKSEGSSDRAHRASLPSSIRAVLANIFGSKKATQHVAESDPVANQQQQKQQQQEDPSKPGKTAVSSTSPFTNRALPPLPNRRIEVVDDNLLLSGYFQNSDNEILSLCEEDFKLEEAARRKRKMDYAASITRVKDCGWYWGPISGEMAEKLLANEPDGSFVVRDSSDEHYIFSLTFKLNGLVRHVRIEHDHGNFSFGCLQKFRSNTIVDFIENAVQHSRSGRYLFFLHRRPVLGPMRVQLLHPVSRFKQVQSLQHLCRFVILKTVRRDLINELPLPRRLKDYLNTPHYYSEQLPSLSSVQNGNKEQGSSQMLQHPHLHPLQHRLLGARRSGDTSETASSAATTRRDPPPPSPARLQQDSSTNTTG